MSWKIDHIGHNKPRPRHRHKYTKYKKCISMMVLMY